MRQIIYVSETAKYLGPDELETLLCECIDGNSKHGVTGVLVYIYSRFIQCIEGDKNDLERLMMNIRSDKRHKHITVLRDIEVSSATFPDWNMGFKNFGDDRSIINPKFFEISDLEDLRDIESFDKELFSLLSSIYRSI